MSAADGRDYNVANLQDLIAAKDQDIANTSGTFAAIQSQWDGAAQWHSDWMNMLSRYGAAKDAAQSHVARERLAIEVGSLGGLTTNVEEAVKVLDASDDYTAVLQALSPGWPAPWGPGSINDLEARLSDEYSALGLAQPRPSPLPQPDPNYDQGVSPTSWQGYVTGAAYRLGLVAPGDVPAGTPGGPGASDPPLVPGWLKWLAGGGLVLFVADKVLEIKKEI